MKRNKNRNVVNEVLSYFMITIVIICSCGMATVYAKNYDEDEKLQELHNEYQKGIWYAEEAYTENTVMPKVEIIDNGSGEVRYEVKEIEIEQTPAPATVESCVFYADFIPDKSKKIFESEGLSAELQWYASELCEKNNVPLEIFMALMYRESTYRPNLISSDGHDYGLCQIRDENHDWISNEIGVTNFLDAKQNMRASMFMLKDAKSYHDDTWHEILMVYNGGPSYANRCFKEGKYSSEYSRAIMEKARELGYKE